MENLAGNQECDDIIRRELRRARIPAVDVLHANTEVPYGVIGLLGDFEFRRAWYYWIARGPVPLDVARRIYADPVGLADVRAGGHCMCPPPETQATYYDAAGRMIVKDPSGEAERRFHYFVENGTFKPEVLETHTFAPDPAAVAARGVVDVYHIDSEVGLRLFVDAIRELTEAQTQSTPAEAVP